MGVPVEEGIHRLGVAMVAPQQAYQAASFNASPCAIKALMACMVRARRRKVAALIQSRTPILPAAVKQVLVPLQKAPGGAATQVLPPLIGPHHRPTKLLEIAVPKALRGCSQGSASILRAAHRTLYNQKQDTQYLSAVQGSRSTLGSAGLRTPPPGPKSSWRPVRSGRRAQDPAPRP